MFKAASKRNYPMYFYYPYQDKDTTTVELPPTWVASKLPEPRSLHNGGLQFTSSTRTDGHKLILSRGFSTDLLMVSATQYDAVRRYFDSVRSSDADQIIIQTP